MGKSVYCNRTDCSMALVEMTIVRQVLSHHQPLALPQNISSGLLMAMHTLLVTVSEGQLPQRRERRVMNSL